jgi:hypoxanthine-DNA glycosylase
MSNLLKTGLAPVFAPNACILILGSFPSEISLERQEYYANPRNQFWGIMQGLFGIPAGSAYADRIAGLKRSRIALWDVLHSCERAGSLDSAIKYATPNDFSALFASLPELRLIAFNGQKAQKSFEKWVNIEASACKKLVLLSTSPAAAMAAEKKIAAWGILQAI